MKKYFIIVVLALFALPALCQRGDKIESLKVGFLTNRLNLDPKTAEKFWPVYHQYEEELMAVVRERRANQNETRSAEDILDQEQKALDIKRKYNTVFAKIISAEQLNQLYRAESDFRQIIINRSQKKEMRQEMQQRGGMQRMNDRLPDNRPQRMETRPQLPKNEGMRSGNRSMPAPANNSRQENLRR